MGFPLCLLTAQIARFSNGSRKLGIMKSFILMQVSALPWCHGEQEAAADVWEGGKLFMSFLKRNFTPLPLLLVKPCYENNTRNVLLILNVASRKLPVIPDLLSWEGRKPKSQRKWEMGREFVQGKERKRLKGKQGAMRKALPRACLRERKMGAINLESFPGLRQTNGNRTFVIWAMPCFCRAELSLFWTHHSVSVPRCVQLSV